MNESILSWLDVDAPALVKNIHDLYDDDKLFEAHTLLVELYRALDSHISHQEQQITVSSSSSSLSDTSSPSLLSRLEDLRCQLSSDEILQFVDRDATDIEKLEKDFADLSSWTLVKQDKQIRTYYRREENSPCHSFRTEGILDCPIMNMIACFIEVDLFNKWIPFIKESRDLHVISRFRKLVYVRVSPPIPGIADRDCLCYGSGCEKPGTKEIYLLLRSVYGDTFRGTSLPSVPPSVVRANLLLGGFKFVLEDTGHCFVQAIFNADPQLAVVPYFLLNFAQKHICHMFLTLSERQAKKVPESEWERRIQENDWVYGELTRRLEAKRDFVRGTEVSS
eukprot:GILI01026326.1.p1 GENE.GILI01026326.1~~GILI01026326.1.p1  ORF type:complete len:336 (-),score=-1.56 GILI01026326.1:105-1112(-)